MRQRKLNPEVIVAFTLGVAAGAAGIGLYTARQLEAEHRQAVAMSRAAQRAQSMGRLDVIRAQQAASMAWQKAHKSTEKAKRDVEAAQRDLAAARLHSATN